MIMELECQRDAIKGGEDDDDNPAISCQLVVKTLSTDAKDANKESKCDDQEEHERKSGQAKENGKDCQETYDHNKDRNERNKDSLITRPESSKRLARQEGMDSEDESTV